MFWFKKLRNHIGWLFISSILINIGMWFERFVIVASSLHRDFLPASWDYYQATFWDFASLIGSFGLFFTMFCLFARFLPMVATAEVKTVLPEADPHQGEELVRVVRGGSEAEAVPQPAPAGGGGA